MHPIIMNTSGCPYPHSYRKQYLLLAALIALSLMGCMTQEEKRPADFHTFIFNLADPADSLEFNEWQRKYLKETSHLELDTLFALDSIPIGRLYYVDDNYKVYGYCYGEFGGALMFQDRKQTDSIYYLDCTCPKMIDKRPDGYYITASLGHLDGFGKILFLETPKELVNVHRDSLHTQWKKQRYPGLSSYETLNKLENQGRVLIDTMGLTFQLFFPFEGQNYLIFSNYENTLLGVLSEHGLKTLDTLLNFSSHGKFDTLNDRINGFYHYKLNQSYGLKHDGISEYTYPKGDFYTRNDTIVLSYRLRKNIIRE